MGGLRQCALRQWVEGVWVGRASYCAWLAHRCRLTGPTPTLPHTSCLFAPASLPSAGRCATAATVACSRLLPRLELTPTSLLPHCLCNTCNSPCRTCKSTSTDFLLQHHVCHVSLNARSTGHSASRAPDAGHAPLHADSWRERERERERCGCRRCATGCCLRAAVAHRASLRASVAYVLE